MARNNVTQPPQSAEEMAKLLTGGQATAGAAAGQPTESASSPPTDGPKDPPPAERPKVEKSKGDGKKMKPPPPPAKPLPKGRMGEKCRLKGPNGKPCPGHLTDMSRVKIPPKGDADGLTIITLFCSKCNVVQAEARVPNFN